MRRVCKHQIIWGGTVSPTSSLNRAAGSSGTRRTACPQQLRRLRTRLDLFRSQSDGVQQPVVWLVKDSKEKRYAHPTQKALDVMKWCVSDSAIPARRSWTPSPERAPRSSPPPCSPAGTSESTRRRSTSKSRKSDCASACLPPFTQLKGEDRWPTDATHMARTVDTPETLQALPPHPTHPTRR